MFVDICFMSVAENPHRKDLYLSLAAFFTGLFLVILVAEVLFFWMLLTVIGGELVNSDSISMTFTESVSSNQSWRTCLIKLLLSGTESVSFCQVQSLLKYPSFKSQAPSPAVLDFRNPSPLKSNKFSSSTACPFINIHIYGISYKFYCTGKLYVFLVYICNS